MDRAAGYIRAPPTPCNARKVMSHVSASSPDGVNPHSADAAANTTTPAVTTRRAPRVSASRPPNANTAAMAIRYELMPHCRALLLSPRSA